jgi:hypothetical protein
MGDNSDSGSPGPVHVQLLRIDPALLDQKADLKLSSVDPRTYILIDNDAQNCRVIQEDEFDASFVDKNIKTYKLDGIESWPQVPNPDKHNVILAYDSGTQATVLVGSISLDNGPQPDQYAKSGGVIYPIDQSGNLLFDATNTPNLSYIRQHYWDMVAQKTATDLLFAEIVASFASAVSALGHAGEAGNFVTADDVDGNVPTPAEPPEDKVDSTAAGSGSDQGSGDQSN